MELKISGIFITNVGGQAYINEVTLNTTGWSFNCFISIICIGRLLDSNFFLQFIKNGVIFF